MLKKLKIAKQLCNLTAVVAAILMGGFLIGENNKPEMGLLMLAAVMVLFVVDGRINKRIRQIELEAHQKLPVCTTKAIVLKRRVGYRYRAVGKGLVRSSSPMYYVTFDTERQGQMEFYVSRDVYFSAKEGKSAHLKYKGNEFISFN